jgi:myo-inositol-1-phosphate synthase
MARKKVRVAIVGVGNCASSLVQGVRYYSGMDEERLVGLMHPVLGGYQIDDIEFSAAFDIAEGKVGLDLTEAIFAPPNNTIAFTGELSKLGIKVDRGMTHDGIGKYLKPFVKKSEAPTASVAKILKKTSTDVVVNYLPVGSEAATKWYVEQALEAGCAFVNCMPVFLASSEYWQRRFTEAKLPILGDDVKSQVGATIVHRALAQLLRERGVRLDRTLQLNIGGNTDFLNMLERERLDSKKISKTRAVTSVIGHEMAPENVHIGPSDYVPWLADRKWAYIRLEATSFGNVPLNIELKLEVWDSPNSAGVVIDAVRCAGLALQRGLKGPIVAPSAYFFKSPPQQFDDDKAREMTEAFIQQN